MFCINRIKALKEINKIYELNKKFLKNNVGAPNANYTRNAVTYYMVNSGWNGGEDSVEDLLIYSVE